MYDNQNANNPAAWTYVPDLTRQAKSDARWKNLSLRLTWQLTPRNKINLFWDEQAYCSNCTEGASATASPEATPVGIGFTVARTTGHLDVTVDQPSPGPGEDLSKC